MLPTTCFVRADFCTVQTTPTNKCTFDENAKLAASIYDYAETTTGVVQQIKLWRGNTTTGEYVLPQPVRLEAKSACNFVKASSSAGCGPDDGGRDWDNGSSDGTYVLLKTANMPVGDYVLQIESIVTGLGVDFRIQYHFSVGPPATPRNTLNGQNNGNGPKPK